MSLLNWRTWLFALPIALMVGCTSVGPENGGTVHVTIQGQFEKQTLTPGGFTGTTTLPIRHSYAEVRQSNGDALIATGYLGSDGIAIVDVAPGTQLYVRIYTEYEVTGGSAANDFFQHGGVIDKPYNFVPPPPPWSIQDYEWSVTSSNVTANTSGTLTVTATASSRIAGAFNINDQMLTQGLALKNLEPTLRLPSLFAYWTITSNPSDHQRTYPSIITNSNGNMLTSDGRALFEQSFNGLQGGGANTETDEWDDGVIQENSAHLLFADYSSKGDGSSASSLLRRDNDNVYVSRYRQSESTVAFVGGFCDFLAGAFNNNPLLLDSYVDGSGVPQVEPFDLSRHDQVSSAEKSEFTRGSVAVSLWGIWKNALTGDTASLSTLWQAARSTTALADGTGEYNGATLACYPSYLLGVKSRASGAWSSVVGQLGQENIPEPTPAYFAGTRLWSYFPGSGALVFRESIDPYAEYFFESDQFKSFRFTQPASGSRTITLNGGTGMWMEVFGPSGYIQGSFSENDVQTVTLNNLPTGAYVARVRVRIHNPDTETPIVGSRNYTLSVN